MNIQEALKEISKHAPCPHDCLDTSLGNSQVWARCNDCGATIQQEWIERLRESHEQFMQALEVLLGSSECHKCGSLSGVYLEVCDSCMTKLNRIDVREER